MAPLFAIAIFTNTAVDYFFEGNQSFIYISLLCSHICTRVRVYTHIYVGVLSSSFQMNKLCTQEDRRCASWQPRVFPFPIHLLFSTFWLLFNLNYLKNVEPANKIGFKKIKIRRTAWSVIGIIVISFFFSLLRLQYYYLNNYKIVDCFFIV